MDSILMSGKLLSGMGDHRGFYYCSVVVAG